MEHDPLCTESACGYCECILIAKVRADERDTATSVAAEMMNRAWTNLRAEMEALPELDHEARIAILNLIDGSSDDLG